MNADLAIFAKLDATTDITSVVETRIFPVEAEQIDQFPRLTYEINEADVPSNYKGRSGIIKSDVIVRSQVLTTKEDAVFLGNLVKDALDGRGSWGGITVQVCRYQSSSDEKDEVDPGSDVYVYTRTLNFTIWVEE